MSLRADLRALAAARPLTGLRLGELVGPVTAAAATVLSSVALTVVSAWLITRAWQQPFIMDVTVAVTAVRALGISRALLRYVERLATHRLALRSAARTRAVAYQALAAGEARRALSLGSGALLTRLGADVDEVAQVIVRAVVPAATAAVTGVAAVAFAAALSPAGAAVLAAGLLFAATVPPWLVARSVRATETGRARAAEDYAGAVDEVLSGSAGLRVAGTMPAALRRADAAARRVAEAEETGAPGLGGAAGGLSLAHELTVFGVLAVCGAVFPAGGHSPQWLGVMVLLALAAFEAVFVLDEAAATLTRAAAAARRITAVASPHPGACGGHPAGGTGAVGGTGKRDAQVSQRPHLRTRGLTVGFDCDVADFELDVPFGARREIVAPSGHGKTTLLLTLAGLLPARRGAVLVDSRPVDEYSAASLRASVLFVAEDAHVFATTVRDNLAVAAPGATDAEMWEVLDALGLAGWVAGLPGRLDEVLHHGAESLSGGQRRRLLLARVLLSPAAVLLLDEPTEHLDAAGAAEVLRLLHADRLPGRRAERTVVIVRHPRNG